MKVSVMPSNLSVSSTFCTPAMMIKTLIDRNLLYFYEHYKVINDIKFLFVMFVVKQIQ